MSINTLGLLSLPAELQQLILCWSSNASYPEVHPRLFRLLNAGERPSIRQQLNFLMCLDDARDFYKLRRRALDFTFFDRDSLEALERYFTQTEALRQPLEDATLPLRLQRLTPPPHADQHPGPGKWRDLVPLIDALVMRDVRVHIPKDSSVLHACEDSNVRLLRTLLKSRHYHLSLIDGEKYREDWKRMMPRYLPELHWWTRELRPRQTTSLNERLLDIAVTRRDIDMLEFVCCETTAFHPPQIYHNASLRHRQWPKCSSLALNKAMTMQWKPGIECLQRAMSDY